MPSVARLPARFADRRLDSFEVTTPSTDKALRAARLLAAGEIRNLVLVGPTGVGKTHLAAGVANAVADRFQAAYRAAVTAAESAPVRVYPAAPELPEWANVADLVVSLRLEMDLPLDDRETTLRARRLRSHRGLVVLDDLGREKVSDWTGELVYSLVNSRYENQLSTLVTSNLTPADLAASPYWPAVSRLAEDGVLVEIEAADRRLQGG